MTKAWLLGDQHWNTNYLLSGNYQNDQRSSSGIGSSMKQTIAIRKEIPKIIIKYSIESIIDAPCGDTNRLSTINLGIEQYIGLDISGIVIKRNERYKKNSLNQASILHAG